MASGLFQDVRTYLLFNLKLFQMKNTDLCAKILRLEDCFLTVLSNIRFSPLDRTASRVSSR